MSIIHNDGFNPTLGLGAKLHLDAFGAGVFEGIGDGFLNDAVVG
ncbi:MAG: hypothetical protein U5R48_12570 [Gammaproteobacteria bacterium]|nr:hypothetical protein [Gammaproteobacteria bacterium]